MGGRRRRGIFTVEADFEILIFLKPYKPPNMPKSSEIHDGRVDKAIEAIQQMKNPNIAKFAREFGVPYRTLYGRVHDQKRSRLTRTPVNKALNQYQETALVRWTTKMRDLYLPVTILLLLDWAN
jgi:hypothetical protein